MNKLNRRLIEQLIIVLILVGTFLISPRITFDPIIIPRFGGLVFFAAPLFMLIIPSLRKLPKNVLLVSALFTISILISSIFNDNLLVRQVYGDFGRNTGVLTYFSLLTILFAVTLNFNRGFVEKAMTTMIICGSLISLYGLIQLVGLDPIEWTNQFNVSVLGTFGNPNFMSSFLGLHSVLLFHLVSKKNRKTLILYIALLLLNLLLIFETQSSQGLVLYVIGLSTSTALRALRYWRLSPKNAALGAGLMVVSFVVLAASLRNRLFDSVVSNETLTIRWHYWSAGIKMGLQSPFFGVGFDSYGDWYRENRSNAAVQFTGESVTTNASHNVFIDMFVSGGLPLLLTYTALLTLILKSAIKILRNDKNQSALCWALVVAWICYVLQSLISINHLGLAIWGWFLGGAILGLDLMSTKEKEIKRPEGRPLVKLYSGLVIGALVVGPPVVKDYSYISALESGSISDIERITNSFPQSTAYYQTTAEIFASNELKEKELVVLRAATSFNKRDFISWRRMLQNSLVTTEEKKRIFLIAKGLEPRYSIND